MKVFLLCALLCVVAGKRNPKRWWAKEIVEDNLYVSGRITETHLKYMKDLGFTAVISLYNFTNTITLGEEVLPTTIREKEVVTTLAGLKHEFIWEWGEDWQVAETIGKFRSLYDSLEKPLLFHCGDSWSATFISYMEMVTRSTPVMTLNDALRNIANHGMNLQLYPKLFKVIEDLTNTTVDPKDVPSTNIPEAMETGLWYRKYWQMKPVYKNWFTGGQFQSNYLDLLKEAGIETVLNARAGYTTPPDDTPSQEEVTLLNIKKGTGTYDTSGAPIRQTTAELLKNRIDPDVSNSFISDVSIINYVANNTLEYGDDVGYNVNLEEESVKAAGLTFFHTPIGGQYKFSLEMWAAYKDKCTEMKEDMVYSHCGTGQRGVVVALLCAGTQYGQDSVWALRRARELGYGFDDKIAKDRDIIKLLGDVLDARTQAANRMPSSGSLLLGMVLMTAILRL